jgi:hypothetical protein
MYFHNKPLTTHNTYFHNKPLTTHSTFCPLSISELLIIYVGTLIETPEGKGHLRDLDVDWKMILKFIIIYKVTGYETVHWMEISGRQFKNEKNHLKL